MLHGCYVPDFENYDYEETWQRRSIEDLAEQRVVMDWVTRSDSCLEIGGGYGRITKILEPCFQSIVMVDFSRRNLATAATRLGKTLLMRTDARRLPFKSNSFDCIVAVRVLHHFEHVEDVVAEMVRVAKDQATMILGVPNTRSGGYRGNRVNTLVLIGPSKNRAYIHPLEAYRHPSLELIDLRGLGLFDNNVGKRLDAVRALHYVDVLTSPLWSIKPELFMRLKVRKAEAAPLNEESK